jgi:hypothetical protein
VPAAPPLLKLRRAARTYGTSIIDGQAKLGEIYTMFGLGVFSFLPVIIDKTNNVTMSIFLNAFLFYCNQVSMNYIVIA